LANARTVVIRSTTFNPAPAKVRPERAANRGDQEGQLHGSFTYLTYRDGSCDPYRMLKLLRCAVRLPVALLSLTMLHNVQGHAGSLEAGQMSEDKTHGRPTKGHSGAPRADTRTGPPGAAPKDAPKAHARHAAITKGLGNWSSYKKWAENIRSTWAEKK
jgi:hypothetical protein